MQEMPTSVDVFAFNRHAGLAGLHAVRLLGNVAPLEVQHAMLDVHHRIVVADRGDQAAFGVVGRGGRGDLQARHMHEERIQALRMLRALAPAFADHGTNHHRHGGAAAVHVTAFGGHVDELVHGQHQKVHADMHVDRPHARQGGADGDAGHGVFGQRRAEHALRSVLFRQTARRPLNRLGVVYVQAKQAAPTDRAPFPGRSLRARLRHS